MIPSLFILVHGGYSQWTNWSVCTKTCAGGVQYRTRLCDTPAPSNGGRDCILLGNATASKVCNSQACPGTNSITVL